MTGERRVKTSLAMTRLVDEFAGAVSAYLTCSCAWKCRHERHITMTEKRLLAAITDLEERAKEREAGR